MIKFIKNLKIFDRLNSISWFGRHFLSLFRLIPILIFVFVLNIGVRLHKWDAWHNALEFVKSYAEESKAPSAPNVSAKKGSGVLDPLDMTEDEMKILLEMHKTQEKNKNKDQELSRKQAVFEALEKRVSDKSQEIVKLKKDLEETMKKFEDKEDKNLKSLVKVYESMKPAAAAKIWEGMQDIDILVTVAAHMKETKLSAVMSLLPPNKATQITTMIALKKGIKRLPPPVPVRNPANAPAGPLPPPIAKP